MVREPNPSLRPEAAALQRESIPGHFDRSIYPPFTPSPPRAPACPPCPPSLRPGNGPVSPIPRWPQSRGMHKTQVSWIEGHLHCARSVVAVLWSGESVSGQLWSMSQLRHYTTVAPPAKQQVSGVRPAGLVRGFSRCPAGPSRNLSVAYLSERMALHQAQPGGRYEPAPATWPVPGGEGVWPERYLS
jgi:hypothetical protein